MLPLLKNPCFQKLSTSVSERSRLQHQGMTAQLGSAVGRPGQGNQKPHRHSCYYLDHGPGRLGFVVDSSGFRLRCHMACNYAPLKTETLNTSHNFVRSDKEYCKAHVESKARAPHNVRRHSIHQPRQHTWWDQLLLGSSWYLAATYNCTCNPSIRPLRKSRVA